MKNIQANLLSGTETITELSFYFQHKFSHRTRAVRDYLKHAECIKSRPVSFLHIRPSEDAHSSFTLEATFLLLRLQGFSFISALPALHIWSKPDVCAVKGQMELCIERELDMLPDSHTEYIPQIGCYVWLTCAIR